MADPVADWSWWQERRPSAGPLHLDTTAAGRSSLATLAAAAAHAEREAAIGAYVAQEEAEPLLAEGRANLARLLGVADRGVAFVPSAQAALDTLLAIWPLREGDAVAVVPCEWGPNLDAFAARGLRITEIAVHGDGSADLSARPWPIRWPRRPPSSPCARPAARTSARPGPGCCPASSPPPPAPCAPRAT
jgi:selenocysteine lyase/cysteine desulfurase